MQYTGNLIETLISIGTRSALTPDAQAAYDLYSLYAAALSVSHSPEDRKLTDAAWRAYERIRLEAKS